jgi:hypothetical protein
LQLKGRTWCRTFVAMPHDIAQILDVNRRRNWKLAMNCRRQNSISAAAAR